MNKWLYRAVGAVGVASGALLLSNGVAHAQAANDAKPDLDSQAMRGLVADFFTPMGQHREEIIPGLGGGGGAGNLISGLTGGLTGGGGPGNLLSGLLGGLTGGGEGGGLLSGLTGLAGGLTGGEGGGPLAGLTGSAAGKGKDGGGPLAGLSGLTGSLTGEGTNNGSPARTAQRNQAGTNALRNPTGTNALRNPTGTNALRGTAVDTTAQRPIQLNPGTARQVNATGPMAEALIANAVARQLGLDLDAAQEENLPLIGELPGVSALMGSEGPVKGLLSVGEVANGIPVVGEVLSGKLDPTNLVGNLPLLGQALSGLGKQVKDTTDGLWRQKPLGDLKAPGNNGTGQRPTAAAATASDAIQSDASAPAITANVPALDALPSLLPVAVSQVTSAAAPVPKPAGAQTASRAAQAPIHVGRHRATERPEVADPELETAPLVDSLAGVAGSAVGGNVGTLPLSTLMRNMAIVNDVPLVGELGTQLGVLKALPLVGTLTGLVPVESDTAA